MRYPLLIILIASIIVGCGESTQKSSIDNSENASYQFAELDSMARAKFGVLPEIAENPENEITDEKVALGKALYFDKRLSKDNTQSCNTCHNLDTYGVDNQTFSAGNDGGLGGRNSPTTLNAALHVSQFWDSREPDVEAQAGGPILNPVEMAMPSEEAVVERLLGIKEYVDMFAKAYPEDEDALSFENLRKAIAAFERKLITPTRFDDYIAGDNDALTDQEKRGMQMFFDAACTSCHYSKTVGGHINQSFGLFEDYWLYTKSEKLDKGIAEWSGLAIDEYVFKVPSLRNIEKTAPYFHDGSAQTLEEAVRIMAKIQSAMDLNDDQISQIIDFLKTLTGEVPEDLKM